MKAKLMAKRIHNLMILSDLLARRQIKIDEEKKRKEVVIQKVRSKDVPDWIIKKFR